MRIDLAAVLRNGWAVWRRDRAVLAPLSGLFFFLPQYAVLLLVPPAPRIGAGADDPAAVSTWMTALSDWYATHGWLFVVAALLTLFGSLAIAALYLTRPGVPVGGAMRRALALLPRFALAMLAVAMPLGVLALVGLMVPGGLVLALAPIFYVLGRACLIAPVLAAEPGKGAMSAVVRSWALTRGHGVAIALLVGAVTLAGQLAGAVMVGFDQALQLAGAANPVVLALIDAAGAAATWASMLALVLVEVVLYRRLAR